MSLERQGELTTPARTLLHGALVALAAGGAALVDLAAGDAGLARLLYLPAVMGAAWFVGGRFALLLAAAGAACALVEPAGGSWSPGINAADAREALARLVEFGLVAWLTGRLKGGRERALQLAGRDPLTGLANRGAFVARVDEEINRGRRAGRPLTLVYIDCDHFKEINDTLGHAAGDEALKGLAAVLRSGVRDYDLVGRLGGDEFALLLSDTDSAAARAAVERLRGALRAAARSERRLPGVSIGAATFPRPTTAAEMIRTADEAMYAVKRDTRDGARYVIAQG